MDGGDAGRRRAAAAVLGLGAVVLVGLAPYAVGLLAAPILCVLTRPAHRRLVPWCGARSAAAVVVLACVVTIVGATAGMMHLCLAQAPAAVAAIRDAAAAGRLGAGVGHVGTALGLDGSLAEPLRAWAARVEADVGGVLTERALPWLSGQALAVATTAGRGLVDLTVALFILYYLLVEGERFWRGARRLVPFGAERAEALRARFVAVTQAAVAGSVAVALAQGAIIGTAFALTGLAQPAFWGATAGLLSFVPLVGNSPVWIGGAGVLLAAGRPGATALLLLLAVGVGTNVDNVIRGAVGRRLAAVHPITTLLGVLGAVPHVGIVGVVIGPLAISYVWTLVAMYREAYASGTADAPRTEHPRAAAAGGGAAGGPVDRAESERPRVAALPVRAPGTAGAGVPVAVRTAARPAGVAADGRRGWGGR